MDQKVVLWTGQTDGQTDIRPLHRCLLCTMQPASTTDGNERMVVTKFTK